MKEKIIKLFGGHTARELENAVHKELKDHITCLEMRMHYEGDGVCSIPAQLPDDFELRS